MQQLCVRKPVTVKMRSMPFDFAIPECLSKKSAVSGERRRFGENW
jgi:hypothetical protein